MIRPAVFLLATLIACIPVSGGTIPTSLPTTKLPASLVPDFLSTVTAPSVLTGAGYQIGTEPDSARSTSSTVEGDLELLSPELIGPYAPLNTSAPRPAPVLIMGVGLSVLFVLRPRRDLKPMVYRMVSANENIGR